MSMVTREQIERIEHDLPTRKDRVDAIMAILGEEVTDEELASVLGEGLHAGLRKGSEAPSSGPKWRTIIEDTDGAWSDAVAYCVEGLRFMGYEVRRVGSS